MKEKYDFEDNCGGLIGIAQGLYKIANEMAIFNKNYKRNEREKK